MTSNASINSPIPRQIFIFLKHYKLWISLHSLSTDGISVVTSEEIILNVLTHFRKTVTFEQTRASYGKPSVRSRTPNIKRRKKIFSCLSRRYLVVHLAKRDHILREECCQVQASKEQWCWRYFLFSYCVWHLLSGKSCTRKAPLNTKTQHGPRRK